MSDLSSDSSDSDTPDQHALDLNTVNECVREYEKQQKKERKKRFDADVKTERVIVDESDAFLSKIKLTPAQVRRLAAKERSEKQKAQLEELKEKARQAKIEAKRNLDLRSDKSKPGVAVEVEPKKKVRGRHVAKPKPEPESESEDEAPPTTFQGKKPKMDDIEEKVAKLNQLNQVLSSENPWLARILETRRGR